MQHIEVRVGPEDFDAGAECARLRADDPGVGAVVSFIGVVRDLNEGCDVSAMTLEHYPGMTERAIAAIVETAGQRWRLHRALVVHRVGELRPTDQIVLVLITSAHRGDAFEACAFIMDYLKTRAPFWKKEHTGEGERWVSARAADTLAAQRWQRD